MISQYFAQCHLGADWQKDGREWQKRLGLAAVEKSEQLSSNSQDSQSLLSWSTQPREREISVEKMVAILAKLERPRKCPAIGVAWAGWCTPAPA